MRKTLATVLFYIAFTGIAGASSCTTYTVSGYPSTFDGVYTSTTTLSDPVYPNYDTFWSKPDHSKVIATGQGNTGGGALLCNFSITLGVGSFQCGSPYWFSYQFSNVWVGQGGAPSPSGTIVGDCDAPSGGGGSSASSSASSTGEGDVLFVFGIALFLAAVPFFERVMTVTSRRYDA